MRISDWSSDVCSSDLRIADDGQQRGDGGQVEVEPRDGEEADELRGVQHQRDDGADREMPFEAPPDIAEHGGRREENREHARAGELAADLRSDHLRAFDAGARVDRSEEHTSELQSLMRISYAVFCLKK